MGSVMFNSAASTLKAFFLVIVATSVTSVVRAAGVGTTPMSIGVTVSQACVISTTGSLNFGTYDAVGTNANDGLNATGQISVSCSKGSSGVYIGLDNGAHAVSGQRTMVGQADPSMQLKYNLYKPPASPSGAACAFPGTVPWTNVAGGTLALPTSTGKAARLINVCGTVPSGQNVASGSYSDVVTAAVNF